MWNNGDAFFVIMAPNSCSPRQRKFYTTKEQDSAKLFYKV